LWGVGSYGRAAGERVPYSAVGANAAPHLPRFATLVEGTDEEEKRGQEEEREREREKRRRELKIRIEPRRHLKKISSHFVKYK
jgi:hypothetical protein